MFRNASLKTYSSRLAVEVLLLFTALFGLAGTAAASGNTGVVYTETNSSSGNAIQVNNRAADGTLTIESIL